jgi:hypothetical protein
MPHKQRFYTRPAHAVAANAKQNDQKHDDVRPPGMASKSLTHCNLIQRLVTAATSIRCGALLGRLSVSASFGVSSSFAASATERLKAYDTVPGPFHRRGRARASRDMTMPIGTPVTSAISL